MCLCPARPSAGELNAGEEIGVVAQYFRAFDRVVVSERHQAHSALLQALVHFIGLAVTLAAEQVQHWAGARARVVGVNVKVASHADSMSFPHEFHITTALTH